MTKDDLRAGLRRGIAAASEAQPETRKESNGNQKVWPNRFGGRCDLCGAWVEAEQGQRVRPPAGSSKWATRHLGPCPQAAPVDEGPVEDPEVEMAEADSAAEFPARHELRIWPGKYIVQPGVVDDKHITLRVKMQPADDKFAPGELVVAFQKGSDNQTDFQNFAFLSRKGRAGVWGSFRGTKYEAAVRVLEELGGLVDPPEDRLRRSEHCIKCNAELTNPTSTQLGIGPTCGGWG